MRSLPRSLTRALGWTLLAALVLGLYLAYRWAGQPSVVSPPAQVVTGTTPTFLLTNTTYSETSGGHKIWSVWAGRIEMDHMPGAALAAIQKATLTDIRNGVLYRVPASGTVPAAAGTSAPLAGPPAATFRADKGLYAVGDLASVPNDIVLAYSVRWQLQLTGNVDLRATDGDHLHADSLSILEMINRRNGRLERRIVCDNGLQVSLKDVQVHANVARYDPADRSVECLGGVRGTFREGAVQADSLFWSLKDQVLRCPETASGTFRAFTGAWNGMSIDLKRHRLYANSFQGNIRSDNVAFPTLP
ncbi:MAG TPA: hypothetical protein VFA07_01375 [Chthonomonadaceae bacterium]|nr:hypothetical protein [Chthonomonadaceae bacterium]